MCLKIVGLFRKFMPLLISLSILISSSSYTYAQIATGAKDASPAKVHYDLAKKYLAELKFDEANAELEKALKADSTYVPALIMTARLLLLKIGITKTPKEDLEFITTIAKKALKYSTTKEEKYEAYELLAPALIGQGLVKESIVALERAVELNPDDPTTQGLLAATYWVLNEKEKAASAFKKTGDIYYEKEMYDEAIESYKRILIFDPENAEAHLGLGKSYYKQGKVRKSLKEHKKAIELDLNLAEVYRNLSYLYYFEKNNVDKAIENLKKAIELEPNNAKYHFELGGIYNNSKRYTEAIPELRKALKLGLDDKFHHFQATCLLGSCYFNSKEYDKAKTEFKKIIQLKPPIEEPYMMYSMACLKSKDLTGAERFLKKALEINPDSFKVHFLLGQTYKEMNKSDQAIKEFKKVIELAPWRSDEAKGARKYLKELETKKKK